MKQQVARLDAAGLQLLCEIHGNKTPSIKPFNNRSIFTLWTLSILIFIKRKLSEHFPINNQLSHVDSRQSVMRTVQLAHIRPAKIPTVPLDPLIRH